MSSNASSSSPSELEYTVYAPEGTVIVPAVFFRDVLHVNFSPTSSLGFANASRSSIFDFCTGRSLSSRKMQDLRCPFRLVIVKCGGGASGVHSPAHHGQQRENLSPEPPRSLSSTSNWFIRAKWWCLTARREGIRGGRGIVSNPPPTAPEGERG